LRAATEKVAARVLQVKHSHLENFEYKIEHCYDKATIPDNGTFSTPVVRLNNLYLSVAVRVQW